jgi:nucleotide-binding universal stress UspA family protein
VIQSILLALDCSPASSVAEEIAIAFAKYHGRVTEEGIVPLRLTGVAVVDRPTIERPAAAPIGASAFKAERDEALLADANRKAEEILGAFEAACEAAGVACEAIRTEGLPCEQIEAVSKRHDLIMIGRDTNFHFETSEGSDETVKRLLRDHPRPVVVTPRENPGGESILIAYDGSVQSSRALHMWTLLEFRVERLGIHVISINADRKKAESRCEEAAQLLASHHVTAQTHPIKSTANVTEVLLEQVDALKAQGIVMGAFGHRGLRTFFFGSTTAHMLQRCPVPMFVYQ